MNNFVLKINNLSKRFGNRIAVNNLNLSVEKGDIFGFLGPNGAGKTTTIRMITGLIRPLGGDTEINGYSVRKRHNKALAKVGSLVETPAFYNHLSARMNLQIFSSLSGGASKSEIEQALYLVGLHRRQKNRVKTYSHGMKQRLGIACALIPEPELLVLDEPSEGLDPRGIKEVRDLITELATTKQITIFLSSHILSEVEQICNKVAIIDRGKLITQGFVKELMAREESVIFTIENPRQAEGLLRDRLHLHILSTTGSEIKIRLNHKDIPDINEQLVKNGFRIHSIIPTTRSLEEIFLNLTEKTEI